jgi:alanine-synthesizing transaminase
MFSSRFHWDLKPNRITELLRERRGDGKRILDLTESNPTQAGLEYPAAVVEAFRDSRVLRYHPAPAGSIEARQAIASYYERRGIAISPERILVTASTSEGYAYLFKLLCDPGDAVLVPRPSYPLFEFLADMESVAVRQYPLAYHSGWSVDLAALEAAITPRTRAVVVVNPNNPTGSFLKRHEAEAIARICAARGLAIVADEVFSDYGFAPDPERVSTLAGITECLSFAMSGLSKIAGLPQMKLGWIAVGGPDPLRRSAIERLEWIADTYLSVGTPVQCAAPCLLEAGEEMQRQIRERTIANLGYVQGALSGSAGNILAVEGGWYVAVQVPRVRSEEEWVLELISEGVLVQPGFFYDFASDAFLILSLLTAPEIFREGVDRIRMKLDTV